VVQSARTPFFTRALSSQSGCTGLVALACQTLLALSDPPTTIEVACAKRPHLCHPCQEGLLEQSVVQASRVEWLSRPVHEAADAVLLSLRGSSLRGQNLGQLLLLGAVVEGLGDGRVISG
jgi:hypothetical protein